jgi:YHS domain-containing protein
MSQDAYDYPRHQENVIECEQCGGVAGRYYPAKTYGDPDDCSPAEYTCDIVIDGKAFCSEECVEEFEDEQKEENEEEND